MSDHGRNNQSIKRTIELRTERMTPYDSRVCIFIFILVITIGYAPPRNLGRDRGQMPGGYYCTVRLSV